MNFLEEAGDIQLKPSGLRHRFRLCEDATQRDPNVICGRMQKLFAQREVNDAARLKQIIAYAEDRSCLTRHLLRYFGEDLMEDCGHCGSCAESAQALPPRIIPRSADREITVEHVAQMRDVIAEGHPALRASRQLARFLCGLTSPATTRDRLGKHDAFGMLEGYPFQSVLEQTESMMMVR